MSVILVKMNRSSIVPGIYFENDMWGKGSPPSSQSDVSGSMDKDIPHVKQHL